MTDTIEPQIEEMPPVPKPEEVMKLADSYASINYFDGTGGAPIHGPRSQAARKNLNQALFRVYEELELLASAAHHEAQNGDEQKAKRIEVEQALAMVVEECRGLKEMNDLMAMNADYLSKLLERTADQLRDYLASRSHAGLENVLGELDRALAPIEPIKPRN
jgi:hypothetical protein